MEYLVLALILVFIVVGLGFTFFKVIGKVDEKIPTFDPEMKKQIASKNKKYHKKPSVNKKNKKKKCNNQSAIQMKKPSVDGKELSGAENKDTKKNSFFNATGSLPATNYGQFSVLKKFHDMDETNDYISQLQTKAPSTDMKTNKPMKNRNSSNNTRKIEKEQTKKSNDTTIDRTNEPRTNKKGINRNSFVGPVTSSKSLEFKQVPIPKRCEDEGKKGESRDQSNNRPPNPKSLESKRAGTPSIQKEVQIKAKLNYPFDMKKLEKLQKEGKICIQLLKLDGKWKYFDTIFNVKDDKKGTDFNENSTEPTQEKADNGRKYLFLNYIPQKSLVYLCEQRSATHEIEASRNVSIRFDLKAGRIEIVGSVEANRKLAESDIQSLLHVEVGLPYPISDWENLEKLHGRKKIVIKEVELEGNKEDCNILLI